MVTSIFFPYPSHLVITYLSNYASLGRKKNSTELYDKDCMIFTDFVIYVTHA